MTSMPHTQNAPAHRPCAALQDLATHVADGAKTVHALHRMLAAAREGTTLPADEVRVLLAPAVDSLEQAGSLIQTLQAANDSRG